MKEQARLLLSAYRPGGSDANDPAFAEALALAQRDPQLRAWLEDSQLFDRAISERLRSLDVPPDLRETILAGAKVSRPRHWWQSRRLWAIAAAFVIISTTTWFWWQQRQPQQLGGSPNGAFAYPPRSSRLIWTVDLQLWQADGLTAIETVERGAARLDVENSNPALLVDWLRERSAPHPPTLPTMLGGRKSVGCKAINSNGRQVSVICFYLDDGAVAHLFSTPRAGLQWEPPENHPVFKRHRNWNLASWSSGWQAHMLASTIDEEQFRRLVVKYVVGNSTVHATTLAAALLN